MHGKEARFPLVHSDAVKDSVMISGIFRSGTTILGKIVGSFKNVEYSFEPPLCSHLDYMLQEKRIDSKLAAEILRTYFAEDVMINFHHGRGYNMRENDYSYVFNFKSKEEVEQRLKQINSADDASELMKKLGSRLLFKVPAKYSLIPALFAHFPGFKVVEVQRNLKAILSSAIARKWFDEKQLAGPYHPGFWPNFVTGNSNYAPYFLSEKAAAEWPSLNEETRAVKALNCLVDRRMEMQQAVSKKYSERFLVAKYEDLLNSPLGETKRIAEFLGMQLTAKTHNLVESIKPTKPAYDVDELVSKCDAESREAFLKRNKALAY